jgi:hypothetical protein
LLKKCASTKWSMIAWLRRSTVSNWKPMPTRRSLHATLPSASMSFFDPGHPEADLDLGAALERAGRADGDAAVTEVERQRRGDGVAEAVLNRDAEHDRGLPRRLKLSGTGAARATAGCAARRCTR